MHTGDPLAGLWYPVVVAAASALLALLLVPETHRRDIYAGD